MTKDNNVNAAEPDEREALIPWYVTGKLDEDERAAVEAYLEEHPEARKQLALVGEEIDAALIVSDAIDAPSARMLDRLMADIDAIEGPQRAGSGVFARAINALTAWLPETAPMGLRLAGVAAALVICAQAATIGWFVVKQQVPAGGYETASDSGATQAAGPSLLVSFQDGARAADIAKLMDSVGAVIVDGPKPGGVFVIRLKSATMSHDDVVAAIAALQARADVVKFAAQAR
jgi:anti-sigma factor RsiW